MRCLMCGRSIRRDSAGELFRKEDVLCSFCRDSWKRIERHTSIEGIPVYAVYEYNNAFASCLLQYKECMDEALKPVFLYPDRNRLKRMYRGRTLLLMPSSSDKEAERGFSHLRGIFESLGLLMEEPFVKTDSISQKKKNAAERGEMQYQIALKPDVTIPKRVVLADDVITTGSTIRGALYCLPKGTDVRIFTCALTPVRRERSRLERFLESLPL